MAAASDGLVAYLAGIVVCSAKLVGLGALLALFETAVAKMRVFRVPEFLGIGLMLGLLAMLLLFVSRGCDGGTVVRCRASLAGGLVLLSLMLLYQDRMYALLNVRGACRRSVARRRLAGAHPRCAASLHHRLGRAVVQGNDHSPTLHRIVQRLGIHRTIETVVGIGPTMMLGIALIALSIMVMRPVTERPTC